MANRSDFFSAAIPRQIKKMLKLMNMDTPAERRAWAEAHAIHKRFKQKMNSSPMGRLDSKDDSE